MPPRTFSDRNKHLAFAPTGVSGLVRFGHRSFLVAGPPLAPESHPSLEVVYVAKGVQRCESKGVSHDVVAGECFWTLPRERHSSGGAPRAKCELFYFQLNLRPPSGRFLAFSPSETRDLERRFVDSSPRHLSLPTDVRERLQSAFESLSEASPWSRARCGAQMSLVLSTIAEGLSNRSSETRGNEDPILGWIRGNLERKIDLALLAAQAGCTPATLSRRFKLRYGMSPVETVTRMKLTEAERRLREEDPPPSVTRLAHDLGFSSSQYFATVFKRFLARRPGGRKP